MEQLGPYSGGESNGHVSDDVTWSQKGQNRDSEMKIFIHHHW